MKVLITGADGFVGKSMSFPVYSPRNRDCKYLRSNSPDDLPSLLQDVEFVFHLAGVNRTQNLRNLP